MLFNCCRQPRREWNIHSDYNAIIARCARCGVCMVVCVCERAILSILCANVIRHKSCISLEQKENKANFFLCFFSLFIWRAVSQSPRPNTQGNLSSILTYALCDAESQMPKTITVNFASVHINERKNRVSSAGAQLSLAWCKHTGRPTYLSKIELNFSIFTFFCSPCLSPSPSPSHFSTLFLIVF